MELENRPFDLIDLIEETIDLFSYQAAERGIDLMYHVELDVPSCIYGDRERLKQVIVNLAGNAIKFTTDGEIIVKATMATTGNNVHQFSLLRRHIGLLQQTSRADYAIHRRSDLVTDVGEKV